MKYSVLILALILFIGMNVHAEDTDYSEDDEYCLLEDVNKEEDGCLEEEISTMPPADQTETIHHEKEGYDETILIVQ